MHHVYNIANLRVGDKIPIYGAKKIRLQVLGGSVTVKLDGNLAVSAASLSQQIPLNIPVIDGKSPSSITVTYVSAQNISIYVFIDEIGGVPYENYWNL